MKLFNQFKRYSIVGFVSTLINFGFYYLTLKFFESLLSASIIGYFMGLLNSYIFGKKWVFKSKKSNNIKTITKFIFVYGLGAILSTFTIYFLNKISLGYSTSWLIGTFLAVLNNFYGSKFFVFKNS